MSRYLVVVAEGGPRNGDKLLVQPLIDGRFLVGRALRAEIPIPTEESATGQQHCYIRIQGGAVWLDTLPYQEVYLDAGRPGFQPRRIDTATSVKLLPQDKLTERVIELGGLAANVERAGPPFTGVGRTRLRIRLASSRDAKIETEQTRHTRRRQASILSSRNRLQLVSTAMSVLALALVAGGLFPVWQFVARINDPSSAVAEPALADGAPPDDAARDDVARKLALQDARLSQYYESLTDAIQMEHRQTSELASALRGELPAQPPAYLEPAKASVWIVGLDKGNEFEGVGTAWVLEKQAETSRRFLITSNNTLASLKAGLGESGNPVIRRTDGQGAMVQLALDRQAVSDQAATHSDFDPLVRMQRGLRNRINVFDVARLSLADAAKDDALGAGLKLASNEELKALSPKAEANYVGFPHDGLSSSASALPPQPALVSGRIATLNDAFLRSMPGDRWQERQVLVVDALATGGSSGSPVFNREGHVIGIVSGSGALAIDSSALSATAPQQSATVHSAYVIRSDVILELIKGERTAGREDQWANALGGVDKAAERADFTIWKTRYCGDDVPDHVGNDEKLDASGSYRSRLVGVEGKALYVSAQIASGVGRLSSLGIRQAEGQPTEKPGPPSRLNTQLQANVRARGDVTLALTGTPLTPVVIDRYACDLPAPAREAGQ